MQKKVGEIPKTQESFRPLGRGNLDKRFNPECNYCCRFPLKMPRIYTRNLVYVPPGQAVLSDPRYVRVLSSTSCSNDQGLRSQVSLPPIYVCHLMGRVVGLP